MELVPVALSIAVLVGLLLAGIPVSISLLAGGIVGLLLLEGPLITSSVIGGTTYTAVARSSLVVVPMFILMGMLTLHSGIAEQLFGVAAKLLRRLPGGLAVATIFASAGFGAVTGSSLASVGTLGRTAITEMVRHGYQRGFASAAVAVSGSLAVLIPPSIVLVLYGAITGESVGALLLAGIIPGILSAVMLAALAALRAWRTPALVNSDDREMLVAALERRPATPVGVGAGAGPATATGIGGEATGVGPADSVTGAGGGGASRDAVAQPSGTGVVLSASSVTRALVALALIFTVVIGGIYTGFFTPSESAGVGAFVALLLIVSQYVRRPAQLRSNLVNALQETVSLNSMIFLILVGAGVFSFFLVNAGVPSAVSEMVVSLPIAPELTVVLLLLALIPGGMFLDSISLLVITVPLVYQPILDLGFNGIWLGILVVKLIELGMITPPIGMNVFVTAGTTEGLEVHDVFKGVIPYYLADVAIVALLFAFPELVTWLPDISAT